MFYLAIRKLRTNLSRITNQSKNNQILFSFLKMKYKLSTQVFRSFARRKPRWIPQQGQILPNGQTHKKANKNQGDLRFLRLSSSELLQYQGENQSRQTKLLGISPKTLTPMEST